MSSDSQNFNPNDLKEPCPKCGKTNVAFIHYGLPPSSPAMRVEDDGRPKVFGGCGIGKGSPVWKCRDCGHHIGEWEFGPEPPAPPFPWVWAIGAVAVVGGMIALAVFLISN